MRLALKLEFARVLWQKRGRSYATVLEMHLGTWPFAALEDRTLACATRVQSGAVLT